MTIRLDSPLAGVADIIQGGAKIGKKLLRPDAEEEAMIKQAIAAGRINPQELNMMGPKEFADKFGVSMKTAVKYTSGALTAKQIGEKATAVKLQELLKSGTPAEQNEFFSNQLGIRPADIRKKDEATATTAVNNATASTQTLPSTIAATIATNEKATADANRERDARIALNQMIAKIGGKENLYKAYQAGQIDSPNLQNIMLDEPTRRVFEMQRDDAHNAIDNAFREKALANRGNAEALGRENDMILARKFVELAVSTDKPDNISVNANDVYAVISDPVLFKMYDKAQATDAKKDGVVDDTDIRLWKAVQTVKEAKKLESADAVAKIHTAFRQETAPIIAQLNRPTDMIKNGTDPQTLVAQYNAIALAKYGGRMESSKIPQIRYGKIDKKWAVDKEGVELIRGEDPSVTTKSKELSEATSVAIDWDAAAEAILDSKDPEAELAASISDAKDDAERKALRDAYAKAKAKRGK